MENRNVLINVNYRVNRKIFNKDIIIIFMIVLFISVVANIRWPPNLGVSFICATIRFL